MLARSSPCIRAEVLGGRHVAAKIDENWAGRPCPPSARVPLLEPALGPGHDCENVGLCLMKLLLSDGPFPPEGLQGEGACGVKYLWFCGWREIKTLTRPLRFYISGDGAV